MRAAVVLVVVALATTGCTGGRPASHTTPKRSTTSAVGCVEATGEDDAHDGVISAGPFWGDPSWTSRQGTKLWVGTSVDQKPTTAVIKARRRDGSGSPVVYRRGPGRVATPDGDPPGLFYPGVIRLPGKGAWRITVTIGADTGCFLMRVA